MIWILQPVSDQTRENPKMPGTMTSEEVVRLGQELYDRKIRQAVESGNEG